MLMELPYRRLMTVCGRIPPGARERPNPQPMPVFTPKSFMEEIKTKAYDEEKTGDSEAALELIFGEPMRIESYPILTM